MEALFIPTGESPAGMNGRNANQGIFKAHFEGELQAQ